MNWPERNQGATAYNPTIGSEVLKFSPSETNFLHMHEAH